MKKTILAIAVLTFVACKKKNTTPEPPPVTPTPTANYSLELFAFDDQDTVTINGEFYTNLQVVINNDTIQESLSNHITYRSYQGIGEDYYDGIAVPTNGISYSIEVGTNYTIKVIDAVSKTLIHTTTGNFSIVNDSGIDCLKFNMDTEVENTAGINTAFPDWNWNFYEGMSDDIGIGPKYYFTPGLIH